VATSTRRTDQDATSSAAVAFYGRTNQRDPQEPTKSARQYRQCMDAIAGLGVISHFHDMADHDSATEHGVRVNRTANGRLTACMSGSTQTPIAEGRRGRRESS
jgi:hypothetical protein